MKNKRIYKGKSLISFPSSFTIIDIETTGLSPDYDEIIEISAIKVSDNSIVDSFSSLIKPTSSIDGIYVTDFITELTGISNDMLASAPDPMPTFQDYFAFLGNDILLGHNINFDINFLYDYSEKLFSKPLKNNFIDTMRISRRLHPEYPHHRLLDVCERYSIDYSNAHRSLTDCNLTAKCYEFLCNEIISQFGNLDNFIQHCTETTKKSQNLRSSDILPSTTDIDISNPLYGKTFVFTGTLEKMTRKEAMQIVVDNGGINGDSITKNTNFLVLGNNDYCPLIKDGKSSKQKKAETLKLQNHDIDIIPENVFYDMLEDSILTPKKGSKMGKDEYISMTTDIISSLPYSHVEKYTMTVLIKMLVKNDRNKVEYREDDFNNAFLESLYTDSINDCESLRRLLHLPVTKELRYVKKENNSFVSYKVKSYQITDWYTDSDSASLTLILENNQTIRILANYFSEMQKKDFEKNIRAQEKSIV